MTLRRSFAGTREHHVRIVKSLGLRWRQQTVQRPNTSTVRGAIDKVCCLGAVLHITVCDPFVEDHCCLLPMLHWAAGDVRCMACIQGPSAGVVTEWQCMCRSSTWSQWRRIESTLSGGIGRQQRQYPSPRCTYNTSSSEVPFVCGSTSVAG